MRATIVGKPSRPIKKLKKMQRKARIINPKITALQTLPKGKSIHTCHPTKLHPSSGITKKINPIKLFMAQKYEISCRKHLRNILNILKKVHIKVMYSDMKNINMIQKSIGKLKT